MNDKQRQNILKKLEQTKHLAQEIRENMGHVEGLGKSLRNVEFELLGAIDNVRRHGRVVDVKQAKDVKEEAETKEIKG